MAWYGFPSLKVVNHFIFAQKIYNPALCSFSFVSFVMSTVLELTLEFSGGAELLFDNKKIHEV